MPAAYTDAAAVAAALRLAPDTTLASEVGVGATSLALTSDQVAGASGLYVGQYLALDQYNLAVREVVQITGAITGTGPYTVPVTATTQAHVADAPVKEVSALQDVVGAGSRLWDDATYTAAGAFGQQTITETVRGIATTDGCILVQVTGRNVTGVSAISWQYAPGGQSFMLDPTVCTFDDYQVYASWSSNSNSTSTAMPEPWQKHLVVTITYTSGYNPLPSDIVRASTVLAARLYKEGDSGFSDVLANTDMGLLQYKKGIPGDIDIMARRWRRWT
ncbi:hypothetical protein [Alicyclobacillus sp. ALC3]|uniref:hypothetical protein n=1 Tax=Alicyclobacillus sp. ALC3 TaxID=2796143 RepID=UPI002379C5C1|nr:hypothetical protein [Alicyclobacillus sp. ALC3]WDL97804.1 hypothetical protein JC200_03475 [Alicyclobacillus sp. ALC3]